MENCPSHFEYLAMLLDSLSSKHSLRYVILIFSFFFTNLKHVCLDLQRLLEEKPFIKAEKCELHVPSVSFLGFVIE